MRDKFYMKEPNSDAVIALRYDRDNEELKVGGPKIYLPWFGVVLAKFGLDAEALQWDINVNRATVVVPLPVKDWNKGWGACWSAGFEIEQVESFRRFMG